SLTDGFKSLRDRVTEGARHVPGTSWILGETHMEVRLLSFGDYEVYYVTGEVIDHTGSRYLPVMAVPFSSRTQTWIGSLDGSSPRSPTREDVAIVRFHGNDLVPFANLGLWRLGLDVSGFRCDVLVRKDRCDGLPAVGNHFTGRVWICAIMEPGQVSTGSYIR